MKNIFLILVILFNGMFLYSWEGPDYRPKDFLIIPTGERIKMDIEYQGTMYEATEQYLEITNKYKNSAQEIWEDEYNSTIKFHFELGGVSDPNEHGSFFMLAGQEREFLASVTDDPFIAIYRTNFSNEGYDAFKRITDVRFYDYIEIPFTLHPQWFPNKFAIPGYDNPPLQGEWQRPSVIPITPYKGWKPENHAYVYWTSHYWEKFPSEINPGYGFGEVFVVPMKYNYEEKRLRIYINMEVDVTYLDPQSGINDIVVEPGEEAIEYFDLYGVKVTDPVKGRLYLKRETIGSKTRCSKIVY